MIDHATPADRLGISIDAKRAAAWRYLNEHSLSVLRHGFTPTKAGDTDVSRTMALARRRAEQHA
jgi:hypothetical protein